MPEPFLTGNKGRHGQRLPAGNEGAGTVIATGDSDMAKALMGQRVACVPGNAFSQYAIADAMMCIPLGDHSSETGASSFVNPMTALGFVETAKMEGHSAIIHLAAASNLGQMLNRICVEDGMKLVNIVRKDEHVELLKSQGATYVVNSSAPTYMADLRAAIAETGAFLGFDPIGGGQASDGVLKAMEQVAASQMGEFSRYGSNQQKKMYIYGRLDLSSDDPDAVLWPAMEHRWLAADAVLAARGHGNRGADAPAGSGEPHHHLCLALQGEGDARGNVGEGRDLRLPPDEDRREVSGHALGVICPTIVAPDLPAPAKAGDPGLGCLFGAPRREKAKPRV